MSTTTLITADQFDTMSFDEPVELIRGRVVKSEFPGGTHGCVCANISYALTSWERQNDRPFSVCSNNTRILTRRDPDTVRGPDLLAISDKKLEKDAGKLNHLTVPPEIAVEVKSPSNSWRELVEKSVEFLSAGVKEVWIVDPESRHVHVYKENTEPTILSPQDTMISEFLPEFSCQILEFFHNLPVQNESENE